MNYKNLVGKTDGNGRWLPLTTHLYDTAGVMRHLVREWVSDSQIAACDMDRTFFEQTAVLAAGLHDIGKCISVFQALITGKCRCLADRLDSDGLVLCYEFVHRGHVSHASGGQEILQRNFDIPESFAAVIGAHHGTPVSEPSINGSCDMLAVYPAEFYGRERDNRQKQLWESMWFNIISDALRVSRFESVKDIPELTVEAQILLTALLITADWIASNTYYFPLIDIYETDFEACNDKRIEEAWNRLGFPENWESEVSRMNEAIFTARFHFLPNDMQRTVYQIVNEIKKPGIFIIEAQMGAGKTEAALSAAEVIAAKCHSKGIYFGLPTQATCNGIYNRLYSWADTVSEETINAIRLAHGGAMYDREYQWQVMQGQARIADGDIEFGTIVHPWFAGNKKALLADFVIGTVDQFLLASLKKRHFMLRHLGLAGKVVIIDECHAYDSYMNEYLKKSLEWMGGYGVPVILLSATLPSRIRTEFVNSYCTGCKVKIPTVLENSLAYPLLTWTDGKEVHQKEIEQKAADKAIELKYLESKENVIDTIRNKLQDGGCACVILNTVNSAQSYYESLKEAFPEWEILLYHAQFTLDERLEKEKRLAEKMGKKSDGSARNRFILVGTQVLEQSLDYDADIMFTQLCPIDMLLQRIGRLHRHERTDDKKQSLRPIRVQNPGCYVVLESEAGYDEGTEKIYGDYLLMRTMKILPDCINIPGNIPMLVQKVYDENDDFDMGNNDTYVKAKKEHLDLIKKKQSRAGTFLLGKPRSVITGMLTNSFIRDEEDGKMSVRDSDSSIEIILLRQDSDGIRLLGSGAEGKCFYADEMPDEESCINIARQRLRLPGLFGRDYIIDDVIHELDERQKELALWKNSAWLKGEEILLLDSDNTAELCGYNLHYDKNIGLKYQKKEE